MEREVTVEAPTVEDAIDIALDQLGVQQDAVEYTVLEESGKRMFGIGGEKPARVVVRIKDDALRAIDDADDDAEDEDDKQPAELAHTKVGELTDDELDQVADEAVAVIQAMTAAFGLDVSIEEYEGDDDELILDIIGADLGVLIGRHGRTLDALQTLVSAVTNRRLGFRYPILVDVEGYRNRRRAKLEEIGRRAADRAVRTGQAVSLRPMSSYERKMVHIALRNDARVVTASEGEEPFRQVVVSPK